MAGTGDEVQVLGPAKPLQAPMILGGAFGQKRSQSLEIPPLGLWAGNR